jgi:uncharacterized repeat protein (TIGR03837 family)
MLWDIFCRVIDNFGDIGVCWRLSADLAARGHQVRLWVDDASALRWMAPNANLNGMNGIEVLGWEQSKDAQQLEHRRCADVWIESFGCEIAPEFIAYYANPMGAAGQFDSRKPVWINLEYLSAQAYAVQCHGLPSPVMHGPANGYAKHFFYPGFTEGTGGLLRETDLKDRQSRFDAAGWLKQQGLERRPSECLISLFCYEPPALPMLLQQLADSATLTRLLVTAGRATGAVQQAISHNNGLKPLWNERDTLSISYLTALAQTDYDHLLWACDLNFVRGEDSVVRALWAGRPFIWQIYPQDDGAHEDKLNAFLDMLTAGPALRQAHLWWNAPDTSGRGALPPLDSLDEWQETVQTCRQRLLQIDDLTTQLVGFVEKKGKI